MAKFKRVNIYGLAARECVSYTSVDLLRQTSIEKIVEACKNKRAAIVKYAILNNVEILLNKMIVDEEVDNG